MQLQVSAISERPAAAAGAGAPWGGAAASEGQGGSDPKRKAPTRPGRDGLPTLVQVRIHSRSWQHLLPRCVPTSSLACLPQITVLQHIKAQHITAVSALIPQRLFAVAESLCRKAALEHWQGHGEFKAYNRLAKCLNAMALDATLGMQSLPAHLLAPIRALATSVPATGWLSA